jgi:ankyrin repeat protein
LHLAALYNSNAAVILELLKAYPEAAPEKNRFGRLPLHWAARFNSNAAVILELLKAYPEAAREKDEDGSLPLHLAAQYNSNAAVILELLKAYPEAFVGVVDIFTIDFTVTFTSGPPGWGNYVTEFLTVSHCYVIPPP